MENEEEAREAVEFDLEKQQEWEEMKAKRKMETFRVLKKGIEMGVPQSEIDSVLQEDVEKMNAQGIYDSEFRIRTRLGLGSPEEIRAIGEKAYQSYITKGDFIWAADLAKDLYGLESPEYQDVAKELMIEEEYDAPLAQITEGATLANLITEWSKLKESGRPHDNFEWELHANFDAEVVRDFQRITSANETGNITVIDFFRKHGISKDDIEIGLEIEFV